MKLFAIFGFVAASNLGANGARLADLTLRANGAQEEGLTIVPPPPGEMIIVILGTVHIYDITFGLIKKA